MAIEEITRPREDGTSSTLLCGRPGCDAIAETLIEITWADSGWASSAPAGSTTRSWRS